LIDNAKLLWRVFRQPAAAMGAILDRGSLLFASACVLAVSLLLRPWFPFSFYAPLLVLAAFYVPGTLLIGKLLAGLGGGFGAVFQRDYAPLLTCTAMAWTAANSVLLLCAWVLPPAVLWIPAILVYCYFAVLMFFVVRTVFGTGNGAAAAIVSLSWIPLVAAVFLWGPLRYVLGWLASPFFLFYAYYFLGGEIGNLGAGLRSRQHFRRMLEAAAINPHDAGAQYQLGLIHQQRRQYTEAIARFQNAVAIDPGETDAHFQLGRIAREQGRLKDALAHFQAVMDQDARHSQGAILRELGALYLAARQDEDARTFLAEYIELRPYDPEGLFCLGQALEGLGRTAEARGMYERAAEAARTAPRYLRRATARWSRMAQKQIKKLALIFLLACAAAHLRAQDAAVIRVHAADTTGRFAPVFAWFGYDEPNYTYTPNGRKLIGELAASAYVPVRIRTHFLLATGDGTPALKWGSTNAYTEDASGKPVYDWTITDRIFETYLRAGARPFVEIGFMPEALSSKPAPYRPVWAPGGGFERYYTGWSYPPRDYAKWAELVRQWVLHCAAKFGRAEAASWYWEVWNEPDIAYWHGSPAEYDKLYDYTADAVKRALPEAKVGGPASTGPASARAADFLRQFLEHCSGGRNDATGAAGAPLDFISYHAKGRPSVVDGHVRMGIAKQLDDVRRGLEIVAAFPKFRGLPIILSESDPEGCAACSARVYPQNAYRNGPLYAAYTAAMLKGILELAGRARANIAGMLTWAFEFEDQPYFDGLRTLATNGIDKPILNLFRMAGLMRGERVRVDSSGAVGIDGMLSRGVSGNPDIDALAVRDGREVSVLAWNYHDEDVAAPDAGIQLRVSGVPGAAGRVLVRHYRIDRNHSNAYTLWRRLGSPQKPAPEQYAALEAAGQLQPLESPRWVESRGGEVDLDFTLPRESVSLVQVAW
jgi:xylan 1,4-beta-xylosidase